MGLTKREEEKEKAELILSSTNRTTETAEFNVIKDRNNNRRGKVVKRDEALEMWEKEKVLIMDYKKRTINFKTD